MAIGAAHRSVVLRQMVICLSVLMVVMALLTALATPAFAGSKNGERAAPKDADVRADEPSDGSLLTIAEQVGATDLWEDGHTGAGVDVAVIDTGVAPVPALSDPDKVVAVVDLSFDAGVAEARYLDMYGHGTHMAGIIAGRTPGADPADVDDDEFLGIAPDAGIVSVKVGDSSGAVDVSQVIAGIDWVIQHRTAGDLNIRVLNLAYGTDSVQPYEIDPLAHAVERAWNAGIVVVVAAGNDGRPAKGLGNPARDPFVIAVGAAEVEDGKVRAAGFSTSGDGARNPDLVAPGVSVESLRVPGSRIDVEQPDGRIDGDPLLFKGSGSSQSAAVVSGGVALVLEARPELTPDQVKALLTETASPAKSNEKFVGNGMLDLSAAIDAESPSVAAAAQPWTPSDGSGSLDAARGTGHVSIDGVVLEGEIIWTGASWTGASWTGASWTGASWTGASWTGASWTGASWTGASWTGASWTGASWTGASWTGASWTVESWAGASWTGASWTGASWTGASWTVESWTWRAWTGAAWG